MPNDDDDTDTLDTHALARLLDTTAHVVETALPDAED